MTNLRTLLATLNANPFGMKFNVEDMSNVDKEYFDDFDPSTDMLLYFDGCDDELEEEKAEAMCDWQDKAWDSLVDCMLDNGFEVIKSHDGSGGGLYYGSTHFRMR